jgi:trypsin
MTFLTLKRSFILSILLFDATSEAAVRGEWKTEHELLHTTTHHEREGPSRGENPRKSDLVLSKRSRLQEWNPFRSFPEVYHHHHHHHGSSNERKMTNDNDSMGKKGDMNMSMVTIMKMGKKAISGIDTGGKNMKAYVPISIAPATKSPTNSIPVTKAPASESPVTIAPVSESPITTNPVSVAPVASPIDEEQPSGEPPANIPTIDAPTPTVDTPTVDAPTPTADTPTGGVPSPTVGIPTADDPTANESKSVDSRSSSNQQIDNAPLLRSFDSRIIGGTPAGVNEFKFMASLNVGCGGSLIAPGIILSAAHCAGNIRTARIGSNKANSGGIVKSVTTECVHPNYQSFTTKNDYMLLKLNSPVDIIKYPPIQLNNNKAVPKANQILTVIGFGTTSEGGFVSNTLLKVNVPANSHQQCNQQYAGSIVENVMFCAGELSGGKDSCQGDSGGPIFEIRSGKAVQVGIVSFGEGCARPNRSGVYSRVSGAYDWIQKTMAKLNNGDTSGCLGGSPLVPTIRPNPPTKSPTIAPTISPTNEPTKNPTEAPTKFPIIGTPFGSSDDDFVIIEDDDDFFGNWW